MLQEYKKNGIVDRKTQLADMFPRWRVEEGSPVVMSPWKQCFVLQTENLPPSSSHSPVNKLEVHVFWNEHMRAKPDQTVTLVTVTEKKISYTKGRWEAN